jgi:hypothetical protein
MLTHFGPFHAIAASRGDGLRPELAGLLARDAVALCTASGEMKMSREQDNKAIVGRWFEGFWSNPWNPRIIDELAAPDMLLQYSLHAPRRGREDVRNFMMDFRAAFPDLKFWGACRSHSRGRLCRRSLGRWRDPHRPGVQRFPCWFTAGGIRLEDALHRDDRSPDRERQDR